MLREILENVRERSPLIHNITNYVTVNDCANILLACGGSPIMADDKMEVEEITSICDGLNINIGTLNSNTIQSMVLAGKKANEMGHVVNLDPVGAGASRLRTATALMLLNEIKFTAIRGNISEIKTLYTGSGTTKGVDADAKDDITKATLENTVNMAKDFSKKTGAVIAITGAVDIIAKDDNAYLVYNGVPIMSKITGSGCQLSAMLTAFLAANKDKPLEAALGAVCAMGYCGEKALKRMSNEDGNASFRNYIIDAVYNLTAEELERGAKYEMR